MGEVRVNGSVSERLNGPMHDWFALSYSNYLVMPRSLIQEMPIEWQQRFSALLEEWEEIVSPYVDGMGERLEYSVQARDGKGRFRKDPFAAYRHSRHRILECKG